MKDFEDLLDDALGLEDSRLTKSKVEQVLASIGVLLEKTKAGDGSILFEAIAPVGKMWHDIDAVILVEQVFPASGDKVSNGYRCLLERVKFGLKDHKADSRIYSRLEAFIESLKAYPEDLAFADLFINRDIQKINDNIFRGRLTKVMIKRIGLKSLHYLGYNIAEEVDVTGKNWSLQ